MKRKLAPFSKQFIARWNAGERPRTVRICTGSGAFDRARDEMDAYAARENGPAVLAAPGDRPAESLLWPVRGMDVLVLPADGETVDNHMRHLGLVLLMQGAVRVTLLGTAYECYTNDDGA